jgi:hypothetical protein
MKSFAMKAVTLSRHSRSSASDIRRGTPDFDWVQILATPDLKLARFWTFAHRRERLFHWLAT